MRRQQRREDDGAVGATKDEERRFGVIRARGPVLRNRLLNALSIFVPLTGALAAVAFAPVLSPTVASLWIFLGFFVAETLGLGLGLHRLFTHRAFRIGRAGRLALGVLGSWAMQGPIDRWVADHRRHHRFTDAPGDPHSPHWIDDAPAPSALAGLWHAHFAWMLTGLVSDKAIYAADVRREPVSRWCSDHYALLCASSLLVPALVGFAVGGAREALLGLLWAGCVRVAVLQQLTWSVNSLGHRYGTKVPGSANEARDNVALAILLFGEGLHSYHHRHPGAALNRPAGIDLNGLILRGLERAGIVWGLRRYDERLTARTGPAPTRAR
jgi:stearoyl-CoA desaturase (delta-9 desaturase)